MSAKTQAKVLRVLQEGEVERVGRHARSRSTCGSSPRPTRTSRTRSRAAQFREDLFFRLNVIPIQVAATARTARGHPAARQALRRAVRRENNFQPQDASRPAALERMQQLPLARQHPRAAQHVERLLIMTPGEAIDVADVRARGRAARRRRRGGRARGRTWPPAQAQAPGRRRRRSQPAPCGSSRRSPSARSWSSKLREQRLEHLEDRRGDRHAAQQPLQEAGTVPDLAGRPTDDRGAQSPQRCRATAAVRSSLEASPAQAASELRSARGGEESPNSTGQCAG